MKNPLRKRLLRELKEELGKYLVIFILLVATIGFVSGFLVADGSMIATYNEGFEKYHVEDGNFEIASQANRAQVKALEAAGVTLYQSFYVERVMDNGSTLRIYADRDQVNLVCLMEGALPAREGEIALDRMYADNNQLSVGDVISDSQGSWTVTGLVALPDYSCLFSDNNDSMFDAVKFGVAIVAPEVFSDFGKDELVYRYSWTYNDSPEDEAEERELAEEFLDVLLSETHLQDFIPRYQNQAIRFTGDDMGKDKAMMTALLYIVIAIMAFVFSITVSNTINKESTVIGALRASGYTRGELVRHYMSMPMAVTAVSAVVGNVLGYTLFKSFCAKMYYGSYSLPTYQTMWSGEAFFLTTVIPVLMMIVINWLILRRKLTLSPLKFLRRDLSRRKQRRAIPLSPKLRFFSRFRLRVIFQNANNYAMLLVGILFANLLLIFGMIFPSILGHYQAEIESNLLCNYQYMLQMPLDAANEDRKLESLLSMLYFQSQVETETEGAEKFSAYSLNTRQEDVGKEEAVLLYGVEPDSQYISAQLGEGDVYISSAYGEKYGIHPGDTVTLKEAYEGDSYSFQVTGIYDYMGALAIFMDRTELNQVFDQEDDYYCGYFSNVEITDIDAAYIGSVISLDDLTKISRQLDVSMGNMMLLVNAFAIGIFLVLVYLLSKIIIERNGQSISMAKILGYTNGEISRLYIVSTSIMVVLFIFLSLPIEAMAMKVIFEVVMVEMLNGWISFYIDPMIYVKIVALGVGTYAVVAALEYRKVRRVPMDEALKNVE